MSGAQGAQPPESKTATTYESVVSEENRSRMELRSREDERGVVVERLDDKVEDASGEGGPVFGAGNDDKKNDLGVTGTGTFG